MRNRLLAPCTLLLTTGIFFILSLAILLPPALSVRPNWRLKNVEGEGNKFISHGMRMAKVEVRRLHAQDRKTVIGAVPLSEADLYYLPLLPSQLSRWPSLCVAAAPATSALVASLGVVVVEGEAGWQIAAEVVVVTASVYLSPAEGEVKGLVSFGAAVDVRLKDCETFEREVQDWEDTLEARRTSWHLACKRAVIADASPVAVALPVEDGADTVADKTADWAYTRGTKFELVLLMCACAACCDALEDGLDMFGGKGDGPLTNGGMAPLGIGGLAPGVPCLTFPLASPSCPSSPPSSSSSSSPPPLSAKSAGPLYDDGDVDGTEDGQLMRLLEQTALALKESHGAIVARQSAPVSRVLCDPHCDDHRTTYLDLASAHDDLDWCASPKARSLDGALRTRRLSLRRFPNAHQRLRRLELSSAAQPADERKIAPERAWAGRRYEQLWLYQTDGLGALSRKIARNAPKLVRGRRACFHRLALFRPPNADTATREVPHGCRSGEVGANNNNLGPSVASSIPPKAHCPHHRRSTSSSSSSSSSATTSVSSASRSWNGRRRTTYTIRRPSDRAHHTIRIGFRLAKGEVMHTVYSAKSKQGGCSCPSLDTG
ncbi:hypothetical protein KC349_g238 [Hortaea werneckii]|nr:hypothetical protein KC349_g238 [Hortaea werneckii]